ncbi:Uncharacterized membrane protein At1g16860 [Linum perenne]
MNDLLNDDEEEAATNQNNINNQNCCLPIIPTISIYILLFLFLLGLSVSTFIFVAVHSAAFLLAFLLLSAFVVSFLAWNRLNYFPPRRTAAWELVRSYPDSDLASASDGELVKITGIASCSSVWLESSYEKAVKCIYTSTVVYEHGGFASCFQWNLAFCERFSTDFYITDRKSGIRALVKAGNGCKVFPLITENKLVTITRSCRSLSPYLRNWLQQRNLSTEIRQLRLEEGYVQEGSLVSVLGTVHKRNDGLMMIVQPRDVLSTGCLWRKLLLPVEVDGLILAVPTTSAYREPRLQESHSNC